MTTEQLEAMQAIQDAYLEMKLTDESVDESARADKKKSISSMLDRMYARADANTKLYKLKQQNKDRKKLPEEVELGESVNHATFIKKYKKNEDDNQHSKNVVHLARHFGSDEDKTEARSILTAHNKAGHLTSEVRKRRDALHKKLWSPVIDRAYNKSTNEEVESLEESRYGDEDDDVRRAENELKRRNIKLPNVKHKEVAIKKTKKDKEEELGEASVFDQARKTVADDEKKGVDPKEKFKLMMTKAKNSQRVAKALDEESLDEARAKKEPMEVFHTGYSAALQHAEKHLNKQGYEIHPDDWHDHISFGPSKPSEGKTVQLHVPLHKDGVKSKKVAHIQVYNRGNTTPKNNELNMYVN